MDKSTAIEQVWLHLAQYCDKRARQWQQERVGLIGREMATMYGRAELFRDAYQEIARQCVEHARLEEVDDGR